MRKFSARELNILQKHKVNSEEHQDSEMPVEYIVGEAEFRDSLYFVDERVLIPRIETEELIDKATDFVEESWKDKRKFMFADIGTGSGVLGISFAKELLRKNITFKGYLSDKYKDILELALRNTDKIIGNKLKKSRSEVTFIQSDLLADFRQGLKFDVIFANLPYIPTSRIKDLDDSVKEFEPIEALDGGEDGADLIMNLLEQAETYLKKSGVIYLEVDDTHTEEFISNHYDELKEYWNVTVAKDTAEKIRFWICTRA